MASAAEKVAPNVATGEGSIAYLDYRLEDFAVQAVEKGKRTKALLEGSITAATLELTIEGATNLVVTIEDPHRRLLRSDLLTKWTWGNEFGNEKAWVAQGRPIEATLDDFVFRLVQVAKQETTLTLTFEDREVTYLRRHRGARKASRGSVTRAQFARLLVREVKADGGIDFYCPELDAKQPIKKSSDRLSEKERREQAGSGLDEGADLTVAGGQATRAQIRQMERCLDVATSLKAGPKAVKAMVVAAIGESGFKAIRNGAGSKYSGVFQADPANIPMDDTEAQAHYFLKGGKGFQSGGAIQAAKDHPEWSAGTIAYKVEGSRANFSSDAEAEHHYGQWSNEAERIIRAYQGGSSSFSTYTKSYEFSRGKNETSWDALGRLAEEVQWRRFMRLGRLWFISEERLFAQKARLRLREGENGVDWIDFDVDIFARGKNPIGEVTVRARADRWLSRPGDVVIVEGQGPADGRWLVVNVKLDLVDPSGTIDVVLRKPVPKLAEPEAETGTRPDDEGTTKSSKVRQLYTEALKISDQNRAYVYGGGHGPSLTGIGPKDGLDCSSSTSLALKRAGMFDGQSAIVSGDFKSWGQKGEGKYVTVWYSTEHVWVEFKIPGKRGKRFDTSPHGSGGSGPHMRYTERSTAGFEPRHWPGT